MVLSKFHNFKVHPLSYAQAVIGINQKFSCEFVMLFNYIISKLNQKDYLFQEKTTN